MTRAQDDTSSPVVPAAGGRSVWRSRAVTLGDQVLSSVSNVLAVVLVARAVSADQFGTFALGYSFMTVVLSLTRAYFGTRVSLVEESGAAHALTRDLLGSVALIAPVMAIAVFALSSLAAGGNSVEILLVVALATPVVCLQDVARYGAVASGRPWAAVWSDGVWVLLMLVPFVLGDRLRAAVILWLWFGAAAVALLVALLALRVRPDLHGGRRELRTRHAVGEATTWGSVIGSVGALWILFMASAAISPAASGSLRGAATAMGPVNVLLAFIGLGLTPMLVRRARARDLRFCALTGLVIGGAAALWGIVLLLLPTWLGQALFGESWSGIRTVLPVTLVEYVMLCVASAAMLGLRVRHQARDILLQRIVVGTVTVVGGAAVAFATRSTIAIATLTAAAGVVSAVLAWFLLARRRGDLGPLAAPDVLTGGAT